MPSHKYGVTLRNGKVGQNETVIGTAPLLRIYSQTGAYPADCATASTGTLISTITLPSDWLGAPAAGVVAKLGTWQGTATASGDVHYWRIFDSGGTVCHEQGVLARPHAVSTAYTLGQRVSNAGNVYRCTVAGTTGAASPPTVLTGTVADGTVTWTFEDDISGMMVPDAYAVSNGQTVTISTFQVTAGNP